MTTHLKSLCVFCGSSVGTNNKYIDGARSLGTAMADRHIKLVYGGGSVGLMGIVAKTVDQASTGRTVTGILPEKYFKSAGDKIGYTVVTKTVLEQKETMYNESDAFIALPGGSGTFEEIMTMISLKSHNHGKPMGVLNIDGYFDNILRQLDRAYQEGFLPENPRDVLSISDDANDLLQKIETRTGQPKPE